MLAMGELHNQVLVSLRRIIRATDLHSRQLEKATSLTTPQLVVMRAIQTLSAPVASEIARSVSLSQATITNILNRLEDHGLVTRARSKRDKRRVNISLTEDGIALLKTAPQPLQDCFIERFGALKKWEQHQIIASLERLAMMMDTVDAVPLTE